MLVDLRGKNALITGGSRGVGRATALLLAKAGARVGIGYHSRHKEAQETLDTLEEIGASGWAEMGDLSDPTDVEKLFARADAEFGGLDIFIGNHGIWPNKDVSVLEMSIERWHKTLGANLHSVFYTCRAAAKRLRSHGRLVLVGSTAGQRGEAFHADYASTKGAIMSLVKGFCIELASRDITVNCVAPGWIDTEMSASALEGSGRDLIAQSIPLGRIATPEAIAGPILFLCSELARHVTGEILNVNGGAVLVG